MQDPVTYTLRFQNRTFIGSGCCIHHATCALMNSLDRAARYNPDTADAILDMISICDINLLMTGKQQDTVRLNHNKEKLELKYHFIPK